MNYSEKSTKELLGYLKNKFHDMETLTFGMSVGQSRTSSFIMNQCLDGTNIVKELFNRIEQQEQACPQSFNPGSPPSP